MPRRKKRTSESTTPKKNTLLFVVKFDLRRPPTADHSISWEESHYASMEFDEDLSLLDYEGDGAGGLI